MRDTAQWLPQSSSCPLIQVVLSHQLCLKKKREKEIACGLGKDEHFWHDVRKVLPKDTSGYLWSLLTQNMHVHKNAWC